MLLYSLATATAKSLQSCPTLCDSRDGSPPGSCPWDSPGKNTGAGCHFLLQCMQVKSESEVAQSCLTLRNPTDCSPPGSSAHGIFQARVLEWGAITLSSLAAWCYVCQGFPGGTSGKEPSHQYSRHKRNGFHPWVGTIPWKSAWQPTQYSYLENPMDRGACRATTHRVAKSQTRLKRMSTTQHNVFLKYITIYCP